MRVMPGADEIRALVRRTFAQYASAAELALGIRESILVDDGQYVARTYRTDGLMAMWMVGVGLVQFYDAEGNMLRTVNLFEEQVPQTQRSAA